jgi:NarL family two-component system response regulator LiaR
MRRPSKVRKSSPAAKHSRDDRRVHLTARQLEIALLMADGVPTREIAARIDVSPKTVEFHRSEIYKAVGVKNLALLVRYLIREGLLKP